LSYRRNLFCFSHLRLRGSPCFGNAVWALESCQNIPEEPAGTSFGHFTFWSVSLQEDKKETCIILANLVMISSSTLPRRLIVLFNKKSPIVAGDNGLKKSGRV